MTGAGPELEGPARDEARDAALSVGAAPAKIQHADAPDLVHLRHSLDAFLETLTPFQREFYRAVLASAPYGGHDSTSRPVGMEGTPSEMAAMVYAMDTGQGMGFDSVYVGWNDTSGVPAVRELVREREYVSHLEAHIEDDILVLTYGIEGTPRTVRVPVAELRAVECENRLEGSDRMLTDLHLAITQAPRREPFDGVKHGFTVLASEKPQKAA